AEAFDYSFPSDIGAVKEGNSYSAEMNAIIKAFRKEKGKESKTYYIFMVPSLSGGASGYMPMKGQFGFVKISGNPAHTIAHELGHGAFRLWHTFSTDKDAIYIAAQGATDNLMDYTDGKTRLYKHQWDLLHDPERMLFPSSVDEDEQMMADDYIPATKHVWLTLDKYPDGTFFVKDKPIVHIPKNSSGTPLEIAYSGRKWAVTVAKFFYEKEKQEQVQVLYEAYEGHIHGLKPSAFYDYSNQESLKQKEEDDSVWKKDAENERVFDPVFMYLQGDAHIRKRDELAPERYNKTSDYYNNLEAATYLIGEIGLLKGFLKEGKPVTTNRTNVFSKTIEVVEGGNLLSKLTGNLRSVYAHLLTIGGRAAEQGDVIILFSKNGEEIAQIANNKLLPTATNKYDFPINTSRTSIGQPCNGYQLVKEGDDLLIRRVPDKSPYTASELRELTQHPNAHILERHGSDVPDEALIKRAHSPSYAPDGNRSNTAPPHSSKFESADRLKEVLNSTKPGTANFNPLANENIYSFDYPATGTASTPFGYGIPSGGGNPVPMYRVRVVYVKDAGIWKLLTMYPQL
ncbi:MAG: hypothetical protein LBL04_09150, partial [Bacteroidales bacterium]|nr:hypothetical protein [Bacteroidales bacterium]